MRYISSFLFLSSFLSILKILESVKVHKVLFVEFKDESDDAEDLQNMKYIFIIRGCKVDFLKRLLIIRLHHLCLAMQKGSIIFMHQTQ